MGFSVFGPCFVVHYLLSFLFLHHPAGCFTLINFLMSYDNKCSVALPHVAVGLSAVCDCCTP